ncbi:YceI family protein [Aliibacillus thermotolerans]|uniref:YceI family protein n=1 Tax=Aliibacillus thermotolerans TaxID=1834418 RepID=A0ABW0U878_9BACI
MEEKSIQFEVKHMMVSKVRGQFDSYDLTDLTTASIAFEFDVASINTHSEDRDNHLRSEDFFDVEKYPTITFQSTDIQKDGDDYEVTGDLTIKDVTKPVTFATNPWGVEVYEEFGLTWNAALETGGVLVAKDIKI